MIRIPLHADYYSRRRSNSHAAAAVRRTVGRIMARQKAMPQVSLPVAGHKLNDGLRALGTRTPRRRETYETRIPLLLLLANSCSYVSVGRRVVLTSK